MPVETLGRGAGQRRAPGIRPAGSRFPGPAAARDLMAGLIDAGARHLVLAAVGMPSVQWVADEMIEPVLAMAG